MLQSSVRSCLTVLLCVTGGTATAGELVRSPTRDLQTGITPLRSSGFIYEVVASKPRLNRKVLGPVSDSVQGVAARPVDSFVWNGDGSVWIDGALTLRIDPVADEGLVEARWVDAHGSWTFRLDYFTHPDAHSSGIRFNSSVLVPEEVYKEPVAENVYLHGDSGAGPPVLPTVFAHLAAWGRGSATLNGEAFENPYGFPGPDLWDTHVMVTEGARWPDGSVRTVDGDIYDPSRASEGLVDPEDLEVHLTFHDLRSNAPVNGNVPPLFKFFYHLVFEEVEIRIVQREKVGEPSRGGAAKPR